ncbi:MAG: MGH1-like glycoside hydrolase domain-containing protein [Candidatus Brocadiia bacterium]
MFLNSSEPVYQQVFEAAVDTLRDNVVDFTIDEEAKSKIKPQKRWIDKPPHIRGQTLRIWSPASDAYDPRFRGQPHNRDVSFVIYHGGAFLHPEIARETLLSCLWYVDEKIFIADQYWDKIAWTTAAWTYYLITGDEDFLELAYTATRNTLLEDVGRMRPSYNKNLNVKTPVGDLIGYEYNEETGLFRGPETFGDGRAKYPPPYNEGWEKGMNILRYVEVTGKDRIQMQCIGTNCLYYNALRIAAQAAGILGRPEEEKQYFAQMAEDLKTAINDQLWLPEKKRYAYFLDGDGQQCEYSSTVGQMLAIITGVADRERAQQIIENTYTSEWGVPCTWPMFPRFDRENLEKLGTGNGSIWPFIQGFAGWAGSVADCPGFLGHMLAGITKMVAESDGTFYEAYHLVHGTPYKGYHGPVDSPQSRYRPPKPNQSWSASGYLAMIVHGVFGLRLEEDGIRFDPAVPSDFAGAELREVRCRNMTLDLKVDGEGTVIEEFRLDGERCDPHISYDMKGKHSVEICVS